MAALSNYSLQYRDFSKEDSTVTYTGAQMDDANFAAQIILAHNLRSATDGITLGARQVERVVAQNLNSAQPTPTDKNAQRERKWLVVYKDTTQYYDSPSTAFPNTGYGKVHTVEVPTADLSLLTAAHSDRLDADDPGLPAAITAYITAFEAFQLSPYGGESEIIEMVAVGRNL